jgi:ABC-type amino acid transport substrate-binding protein
MSAFSAQNADNICAFQRFDESITPQLRVAYFELPPYATVDTDGAVKGLWIEYFKELLNRSGIRYTEALYPPNRLATKIFSGEVDITLVANNILMQEGLGTITFLPEPVMSLRLGLVSTKAAPRYTVGELKGKNLGVNRGYGYGGYIHQLMKPEMGVTLWPVDSELQLIKLVLSRRLESVLLYESVLKKPPTNWAVDLSPLHFEPLRESSFYIAMNNKVENYERLKSVLMHNMALFDLSLSLRPCVSS